MTEITFECRSCGSITAYELLPLEYAVSSTARKINREAECCENPEYVDDQGFVEPRESLIQI